MGSTYLSRQKYNDLLTKFAGIEFGRKDVSKGYLNLDHYKGSPALGACSYYVGIAHLVQGNFEGSKPYLESIVGVSVQGVSMDQDAVPPAPEPVPEETPEPAPEP